MGPFPPISAPESGWVAWGQGGAGLEAQTRESGFVEEEHKTTFLPGLVRWKVVLSTVPERVPQLRVLGVVF